MLSGETCCFWTWNLFLIRPIRFISHQNFDSTLSSELFVSSHRIVFLPFILPFFSRFVLLSLVFFFDSLLSFFIPHFLFLLNDLFFYLSFCFFFILHFVFLSPLFFLSSKLFVNARCLIFSPFVAKLTTKIIASDQKSSLTLWQSERISGPPRTAVKVSLWSNRSVRRLRKFVDQRVER
jgi:hypothetical protein